MAYLNLNPSLKNTRSSAITTAIGTSGNLLIYSGTQPSDPSQTATGTLLATCALSATAGSSSGGTWTANAITQATTGVVAGTAGWARLATSGGTGIVDVDVGTSGTTFILNAVAIAAGGPVVVSSGTIVEN